MDYCGLCFRLSQQLGRRSDLSKCLPRLLVTGSAALDAPEHSSATPASPASKTDKKNSDDAKWQITPFKTLFKIERPLLCLCVCVCVSLSLFLCLILPSCLCLSLSVWFLPFCEAHWSQSVRKFRHFYQKSTCNTEEIVPSTVVSSSHGLPRHPDSAQWWWCCPCLNWGTCPGYVASQDMSSWKICCGGPPLQCLKKCRLSGESKTPEAQIPAPPQWIKKEPHVISKISLLKVAPWRSSQKQEAAFDSATHDLPCICLSARLCCFCWT